MVDLGKSPLCESFLPADQLEEMEPFYPLHVRVVHAAAGSRSSRRSSPPDEIFTEYAYFSAYSDSWVEHARDYVDMITERLGARRRTASSSSSPRTTATCCSTSCRRASRCSGSTRRRTSRAAAEERGVPTLVEFFGVELAERLVASAASADLVARQQRARAGAGPERLRRAASRSCSRRAARRPSSSRTSRGCSRASSTTRSTTSTSLLLARRRSARSSRRTGSTVVDVEELPTPRRLAARLRAHATSATRRRRAAVAELAGARGGGGPARPGALPRASPSEVEESKRALLELLIELRREGKQVVGYGAPGKGNTLLNYCGIRTDFLDYTVDRNPYKHGRFTPGTHIPIHPPERIAETRPDAIVILPWNLATEIAAQLAYTAEWGAQLIVPIPTATVLEPCSGSPVDPCVRSRARRADR